MVDYKRILDLSINSVKIVCISDKLVMNRQSFLVIQHNIIYKWILRFIRLTYFKVKCIPSDDDDDMEEIKMETRIALYRKLEINLH